MAAIVTILGVAFTSLFGSPAGAQPDTRIDLVAQTTFVTDDPVVFDLRITGALTDRRLNVRVFEPIDDHQTLATVWANPPGEESVGQIANFDIVDLATLTEGSDVLSITLPDEEIGLILRRETGALPVVIELQEEDGTVVDTFVTAIVVDDDGRSSRIDFGFISDARAPLAHTATIDASVNIDPAATIDRLTEAIDDAPGPTLVRFTPETITALANPQTTDGLAAIDTIRSLLTRHQVPLSPWVEIDEAAWRGAGEGDRVFAQYAQGQAVMEDFLAITPASVVPFDFDTDPETLSLLRSVGVTGGVVEPEQLNPADLDRADNRPITVADANGVTMPVLVIDRAFEASLDGLDPELVAQHRFTELVLRARTAGTNRAIVLDLATVDHVVLNHLLELAAGTGRVGTASLTELLNRSPARDATGAVLRAELITTEPGDVAGAASDLRLNEALLISYAEMVAPADTPVVALQTVLTAAMSDALSTEERRTYTDIVFNLVSNGAADFSVVEASRITLATRTATLPIEIRNDQTLPINVIVRVTSEKLRFPSGDQFQIVLEPGLNLLELPVETVASGDARMQVSITSPDDRLNLATGALDIRSTAVSGLGLIVSVVAFAVLLTWWARTIARVRRQRRTASVPGDPPEEPTAPPTDGASAASPTTDPDPNQGEAS